MRKTIFLLVFLTLAFSVFADDFITTYDDVMDMSYTTHKDMKIAALYNLRDSLTGERANVRLYYADDSLVFGADYQFSKWLDIKQVVFISDAGRFAIDNGDRTGHVVSGTVLRENYTAIIDNAADLKTVLQGANPVVSFVGSKTRSDKYKIKPKVIAALIATIDYKDN